MADPIPSVAIVLDRPQNSANIGAVVRAMKNMGFSDLRLVNPAPFGREDLLRYAHRCDDLVASLTVHATLDEALADTIFVVGTAALQHPDRPTTSDVRALAADLLSKAQSGVVALLFGTEADGLDRAALDRCHLMASLPTSPDYPALNLAQSVLIFLHELRMADDGQMAAISLTRANRARQSELTKLFEFTEQMLVELDFFRYSPEAVMRDLRTLIYRAELTSAEAALLIGIVRKVRQRLPNQSND